MRDLLKRGIIRYFEQVVWDGEIGVRLWRSSPFISMYCRLKI